MLETRRQLPTLSGGALISLLSLVAISVSCLTSIDRQLELS